ncbi:Poly [ADP-ribose] polymerase [Rhynchospora pubera]|uniref:Poly [ADP-ribose] polymerase n=1 Tax=Rhynchospora pubera TaxID=906938 RepID=A0AAV8CDN9_9POAL|nr:Poly [ADP-ribose] polymerase [Rhynchospora pubera]
MKGPETRSRGDASGDEEGGVMTRSMSKKQKMDGKEESGSGEKDKEGITDEFQEFCKGVPNHLTVVEMRKILEANDQDPTGPDDAVVPRVADLLYYGPLGKCPICKGFFEFRVNRYICGGNYSEWSRCPTSLRDPPRKNEMIKVPEGIADDQLREWIKKRTEFPKRELPEEKPLKNMVICLSGRLSRRHDYWRQKIEKCGGEVARTSLGVACLVVPPAESERGGSNKTADALEMNVPIVSEQWLVDTLQNNEVQPLEFYDMKPYLVPDARGIAWDTPYPVDESMESLVGEIKLCGKKGVHKDSRLHKVGGRIMERDGIVYNCAFSLCDLVAKQNDYAVTQLIMLPDNHFHLFYKKSRIGDDPKAEERVEDFGSRVGDAISEFVRLFEELTGNEFELWEREKKFQKKAFKFYALDMDIGVDIRRHGLAPRNLGVAALHCKLDPFVSSVMKILCSQEIYRYALMEMAHDVLDIPIGMLTNTHLERCEKLLVNFREELKTAPGTGLAGEVVWIDFSNKWFTMMPSIMPFTIRGYKELADYVAAGYETVKDINVASRVIGDLAGGLDDPLSDCYAKIGCSICLLDKESEDYKMIVKYLKTTYEPYKVDDVVYGVSVENIFEVQANPNTSPTYDEIKKLPNKLLLWCGTRSSNLVRHLNKGFQPAVCQIPVSGYMFGRGIVCSDASAEAAQYAFTGVDRPEGFLMLAVFSLGEQFTEISTIPEEEEVKSLEEKRTGVKGLGRKKTDEAEHFTWKDDIKVPCGRLVPSDKKDSPLEYNEYTVYDPKQVCMKFMVWVKYEEQNMEVDVPEAPEEEE